jgi:exo-1,4-beta-D-glucosaminidase
MFIAAMRSRIFRRAGVSAVAAIIFLIAPHISVTDVPPASPRWSSILRDGWRIHSSTGLNARAGAISTPGLAAAGWYSATLPSTVLAALVRNHVYPDPYFGMNLRALPGMGYKIGENFSRIEMPGDSPFRVPWWYRAEFTLPSALEGKTIWLDFHGINYRADIWMNGQPVADATNVAGTFRRYEFDVTKFAHPGGKNALAVLVYPPTPEDLALTWVDWNPAPPDKDMGLWDDVIVRASGPVAIRQPQVSTHFDLPSLDVAHLTVRAQIQNASANQIVGALEGAIGAVRFSQQISLAPGVSRSVQFSPKDFPQLNLKNPSIWWPYRLGDPNLQHLRLVFRTAGGASDEENVTFGISEITSELTPQGHRLFRVNGHPILIRGAGWAPDMMLQHSPERLEAQTRYVREMNLNTIRLEGKLDSDDFFDLADRYGILVMAGWCCCDHWERWDEWSAGDRRIAAASLADQAARLGNHPSVLVWLNGSDRHPPADVERMYLDVLQEANWPKPVLSSATEHGSSVSGATGVKMSGPYDYVPPNYWLQETSQGGAMGFNTETSPGAAIPPVESLRKMLPPEHLWPPDEYWDFHAGGGAFKNLQRFNHALDRRYGAPRNLQDYVWKAEAASYEGERAMFEAWGRNKYEATGVIQWMLNNAWPSIIWHLFDYYLQPGAGYFATRKACEPVHAQYSYDDGSFCIVNDSSRGFTGLQLAAHVYDFDMQEKFAKTYTVDAPADTSPRVGGLPDISNLSPVYFLRLDLRDAQGQIVSTNFYWLSKKPDTLNSNAYTWYYTPESSFADFSELSSLEATDVRASGAYAPHEGEGEVRVRLENPSPHLAFLVRLQLLAGNQGQDILPIYWDDNYISLLPGELRHITARFPLNQPRASARPVLAVDGWNVPRKDIPVQ